MNIRIATDSDIPAITEIYNQAIRLVNATAHIHPVTETERHAWLQTHDPDIHPVFVAEVEGVSAGYGYLSPYRPGRDALKHTKELSYYVHEKFHRQGVGSALVAHAIELAPTLNVRTLFAIMLDNNPVSVKLLEKFGFEQWGFLPGVADFGAEPVSHLYYGRHI